MPPNRLREIREERGLTATDVAAEVDVDPSTISRWERGLIPVPDWAKLDLADFYEVKPAWLMGWED